MLFLVNFFSVRKTEAPFKVLHEPFKICVDLRRFELNEFENYRFCSFTVENVVRLIQSHLCLLDKKCHLKVTYTECANEDICNNFLGYSDLFKFAEL